MADFFSIDDSLSRQIAQFIHALDQMEDDVAAAIDTVADKATEEILSEQRRLLSKQHPQLAPQVQAVKKETVNTARGDRRVRVEIGYDTDTIDVHPEVLIIEFGRPGKSSRCDGVMQKKKRHRKDGTEYTQRKGDFPTSISHIRAGFDLAKPKILRIMEEELLEHVVHDFDSNE